MNVRGVGTVLGSGEGFIFWSIVEDSELFLCLSERIIEESSYFWVYRIIICGSSSALAPS